MKVKHFRTLGLFVMAGFLGGGCAFYAPIDQIPPSLVVQGSVSSGEGEPIPGALIYIRSSNNFSNSTVGSRPVAHCEFGSGTTGSIDCVGDMELPSGVCAATCPCPDGQYTFDISNCSDDRGGIDNDLVVCYQGVCSSLPIQCEGGECSPGDTSIIRPTTLALDTYNSGIDQLTAAICDQVVSCEPTVSFDACMIAIEDASLGEEFGYHPLISSDLSNVVWNLRYRLLGGSLLVDENQLQGCIDDIYQSSCDQFDVAVSGSTLYNLAAAVPFSEACQEVLVQP